jgi:hypothetical protein
MHHDLAAMHQALKLRGVTFEQILCLEGTLDRHLLLRFLEAVHRRIEGWTEGTLFLYVTGHGFFTGESVEDARVGVELRSTEQVEDVYHVFWDELFGALSVHEGVSVALLPDH